VTVTLLSALNFESAHESDCHLNAKTKLAGIFISSQFLITWLLLSP